MFSVIDQEILLLYIVCFRYLVIIRANSEVSDYRILFQYHSFTDQNQGLTFFKQTCRLVYWPRPTF